MTAETEPTLPIEPTELPVDFDAILERRIAEAMAQRDLQMGVMPLPPNAFRDGDGNLMHKVRRMSEGGGYVEVTRPLAASLEEAREKRIDFYHPTLGLIWEGYKLARDRSPQSVMSDGSVGGLVKAGDVVPDSFTSSQG